MLSPMADAQPIPSPQAAEMSIGSQLCTKCGLCCAGALHDNASAKPHEFESLRKRGMQVVMGEELRFALPCPHLKGTSCGIYDDRPHVCSRYRCQLLRDVEAGTADLPDALLKVREARRLHDAVQQLMPAGMSLPQARSIPRNPQYGRENVDPELYPALFLHVLALMRYVDQHFRHSDEGPLLSEEVLTMDGPVERLRKDRHDHV